jgi:hypothetical protein
LGSITRCAKDFPACWIASRSKDLAGGLGLIVSAPDESKRKRDTDRDMARLRELALSLGSWVLPIFVLVAIFAAVALLTQGDSSLVQRIYTSF